MVDGGRDLAPSYQVGQGHHVAVAYADRFDKALLDHLLEHLPDLVEGWRRGLGRRLVVIDLGEAPLH